MTAEWPDLCARCGNQFPAGQVCRRHDDWALDRAAVIIESRARRRTILLRAWCKVMRRLAARIREDAAK